MSTKIEVLRALIMERSAFYSWAGRVGAEQPHFRDGSRGKVHHVVVTVAHQSYAAANNYHTNEDRHLVQALNENWERVRASALAAYDAEIEQAREDARADLQALMGEVAI